MNSKFDKRFSESEREKKEHTTGLADGGVKDKEVFNAKRDADVLQNGSEKRKFGWLVGKNHFFTSESGQLFNLTKKKESTCAS